MTNHSHSSLPAAQSQPAAEPNREFAAFVGLDWADREHAVCVLAGEQLRREVLPHTPEAIAAWAGGLARDFGGQPVAVMVEQSRGALLQALVQYPQLVLFPINPKQAARYREALVHSGKKDDPTDAECLARFVREHHRQLRAWKPADALTRQLAQLVELRRKAVDSRKQITQQWEARLKQYFPLVLDLGDTALNLAVVERWPTHQALARANPATLRKFFAQHGRRNADQVNDLIARIRAAKPLTTDHATIEPLALAVKFLVKELRVLEAAVAEFDAATAQCFEAHPDAELFRSPLGAGAALAPRLLVAFGADRGRSRTIRSFLTVSLLVLSCWLQCALAATGAEPGLVGHWPLSGDSQDHSGQAHHATTEDTAIRRGLFDGRQGFAEVPSTPALQFGTADFSIATWINTEREVRDCLGDILSKVDPATGRGLHLALQSSSPGYNSQSNVRQVFFGLGGTDQGQWTDCGRPGGKAHSSDALTVFHGDLYAGTTDGPTENDWAHVYRYRGDQNWEDCGRLGTGKTRGVYAMIVHDGSLYAATSSSHGPQPATMSHGRVYRYQGGQSWEDIGQPGENFRLNALASFRGKLYVVGFNIGPKVGHCYEYQGDRTWKPCGEFAGWPHTLLVHDDRLHAAYPSGEVYAYDGQAWENLGNPYSSTKICSQIHALGIHRGELYAGAWPSGQIAVRRRGQWIDLGRAGDCTEIVGLTVYNGSLYAGTIPRAEVFRFDGPGRWTSQRRLFDPPGFEPVPVGGSGKGVADWSRASSLAVFQGKLFVSTASCYRTNLETPLADEPRGKVFAFQSGAAVSFDNDLGPGWKHITAVRRNRHLELFFDGQPAAKTPLPTEPVDVSNSAPLQIGFGPQAHFRGNLRDVRLYNRALTSDEIQQLAQNKP